MKIGLCTGGGDCPGLNAAIRAIVKHAIGTYGMEVIGIKDSFNGLESRPYGVRTLGLNDVSEILNRGGTILGTTNAGDPFKSDPTQADRIKEAYNDLGLDGIVVIGGDGTQSISGKLHKMGVKCIGVPKTIDNDLAATDVSIGFQTSVDIATDAISRLKSTAESHERVMVLELMGRDAGHIAIHSGIAGGANTILVPEIPFSYEAITKKIKDRQQLGRRFSIVVVSEGAYEQGTSQQYKEPSTTKVTNNRHLGGIGAEVADKLFHLTGSDTRITVLGHVQRGGSPDPYDRVLASCLGTYAVDLVKQERYGVVVGIKKGAVTETPYEEVIDVTLPLKPDSIYIKTAEALGICLGR